MMVSPIFSCDVQAEKKAFDTITFLESDLTDNSIESIDELAVSFNVVNKEDWQTIFVSDEITVSFKE